MDNSVSGRDDGIIANKGKVSLSAGNKNIVESSTYGIYAYTAAEVKLDADASNIVNGATYGLVIDSAVANLEAAQGNTVSSADGTAVYGYTGANISLTTEKGDNVMSAGTVDEQGFGSGIAVNALSGAQMTFTAENGWNAHLGAIDTRNESTKVTLDGAVNAVYSAAVISNAGGLEDGEEFKGKSVISALYAEGDADIEAKGDWNIFRTKADPNKADQLERVLWAYQGADIDIDGSTYISTDSYSISPNSADIAIAAGTATNLDYDTVMKAVADEDRAHVNLNYGAGSSITGDILAAYAGTVNIKAKENSGAGISVTGNILSGNNGVLNLDLGQGGTLTGRADDYGDAGVIDNSGHGTSFFDPAFSSSILKGGVVNLKMGNNSRWNVTGQSWITSIDTTGSSNALIDLISANTDRNSTAHALTVYDMKGNATFNMSLDANRSISDMLYMKNADGSYLINVYEPVTEEDMYANGFEGLRFATVGKGSNVSFRAITYGQGLMNLEYEVGTDAYDGNHENDAYNSTDGSGAGNTQKPGTGLVNGFFTSNGTPGSTTESTGTEPDTQTVSNAIMTLADATEAAPAAGMETGTTADEESTAAEDNASGATNYKLIAVKSEELSTAGQTILSMSKVNYSNAVYMDRLNKRMGEARYIEGDDGLWVRLRHDRIGKDDAFRSMNTMFELGYDWHAKGQKDGEHRQGVAFDYMRGTADYRNVAGDGDVRRAGVWLYDTWLGDKGHYSDYVVKYGRLSNDFDIYSELGEKISGDYDNDVWSVSAEYGRKKDIGNDWYIEPQAQMQYAYVTSADYTTSQGTKVELDGIDSLIGRAGFRLGRDTSEGNTVYFKADILHEFLGDQSIRAMDATGTLSTTYENEGTWYDVGFGFAHKMGKDSYVFLDVEHSFGNDNDDTYQINIGLNRAF